MIFVNLLKGECKGRHFISKSWTSEWAFWELDQIVLVCIQPSFKLNSNAFVQISYYWIGPNCVGLHWTIIHHFVKLYSGVSFNQRYILSKCKIHLPRSKRIFVNLASWGLDQIVLACIQQPSIKVYSIWTNCILVAAII